MQIKKKREKRTHKKTLSYKVQYPTKSDDTKTKKKAEQSTTNFGQRSKF